MDPGPLQVNLREEIPRELMLKVLSPEEPDDRIQVLRYKMISSRNKSLNEMPAFLAGIFKKGVRFPGRRQ